MKKVLFLVITICILPLLSCSSIIESQLEILGDELDELGESLDELGEELDSNPQIRISKKQIAISKDDKLKTRRFDITDFNALNVGYSFQVVMCDTVNSVTVCVNEKLDKYLVVKVSNGTLNISLDLIGGLTSDGAKCGYVYLPYNLKLSSFSLSGEASFATALPLNATIFNVELAGASSFKGKIVCHKFSSDLGGVSRCRTDIKCQFADIELNGASSLESNIESTTLDADLSGTSKLKGNIKAKSINADLMGASKAILAGACNKIKVETSGTSKFDCKKLHAKEVVGDMSGASDAVITCSDLIRMDISGTSHLIFYGNPKADIDASRAAKVERK